MNRVNNDGDSANNNNYNDTGYMAKHIRLFNLIAPAYNLFFQMQVQQYRSILDRHHDELGLWTKETNSVLAQPPSDLRNSVKTNTSVSAQPLSTGQKSILDIGCGTGAFLYSFAERGYAATGVDFSQPMLSAARKSTSRLPVNLIHTDITKGLPFADKSFTYVTSALMLHGLTPGLRQKVYAEASRLAQEVVYFYDYNQNRSVFTDFIEWVEGGDYFNFIHVAEKEMREVFTSVKKIDVAPHAAIYICRP